MYLLFVRCKAYELISMEAKWSKDARRGRGPSRAWERGHDLAVRGAHVAQLCFGCFFACKKAAILYTGIAQQIAVY